MNDGSGTWSWTQTAGCGIAVDMDAPATTVASGKQGAAELGAWSHAIVRQGGSGCPQCFELALALNIARSDVGHWRALHREAVERESKLKQQVKQLEAALSRSRACRSISSMSHIVGYVLGSGAHHSFHCASSPASSAA